MSHRRYMVFARILRLSSAFKIPNSWAAKSLKYEKSRIYSGWKYKLVISKFQNGPLMPQGVNYEISLRQKGEMFKFFKVRKILGSSQVRRWKFILNYLYFAYYLLQTGSYPHAVGIWIFNNTTLISPNLLSLISESNFRKKT